MTRNFSGLLAALSVGLLCTGVVFGRGGFGGGGGSPGGLRGVTRGGGQVGALWKSQHFIHLLYLISFQHLL